MQLLRQSSATTILIGQAVDATDGFTPETGLGAGTVDEIGVYKHNTTSLTDISGTTVLTHRAGGMYTVTFNGTNVGTAGRLTFVLRDDSVCRPIRHDFMVIPADTWDDLVAAGNLSNKVISGFGTSGDKLQAYLAAMMNRSATAPAGVGNYDPLTDSLEQIGTDMALAQGSGFATGTDSLKQIRNAIDTLIAPAVVGASALSGSGFLSDCVSWVRKMTDEPSLSPKYTDGDIVTALTGAMQTVMSEIHIHSDHNLLCRHDITLVSGQQTYILPPNVGEVWRVAKMTTGTVVLPVYEIWQDNHWSSHQSGFVIEGNEFRLLTDWRSTDTIEILYVPNGESYMHKGTAGSVTASTIVLAASPTDGTLDTRANAYSGYLVRLLSDGQGYVQERTADSYVNTTRTITLSTDWDPTPTGTIVYEVLPTYGTLIRDVTCLQTAIDILANEGNHKRMQGLSQSHARKMRALRLMISKKSSRFPGHALGDTSDNDSRGDYYGWLV